MTRLGLGGLPDQDPACVSAAYDAGVNYFFFYGQSQRPFIEQIARLVPPARDELFIATGSGARTPEDLRADRQDLASTSGVEQFDLFFAEYLHPGDEPATILGPGGLLDEMQAWKDVGLIRQVGVSVHDRPLARQLAADPRVDVLMHRYNMAHRTAATEVFPAALSAATPVVAFTATRWGTLIEPPEGWTGPVPTAADCYRYCLSHDAVALVLTAPKTVKELAENLEVVSAPSLDEASRRRWEAYGDWVYKAGGGGSADFETRWP